MKKTAFHIGLTFIMFLSAVAPVKAQLEAGFMMTNLGGIPVSAGCSPLIIQFTDTSKINGNPITYMETPIDPYDSHQWFFGDINNNTSNLRNPVFAYVTPGSYDITLVVTNASINYDTVTHTVTVFQKPIVAIDVDKTHGCNPLTVQFTDSSSSPGDSIVSWLWDFGGGIVSSQQNPSYTFVYSPLTNQYCFDITLQVWNSKGCTKAVTYNDLICIDKPPEANFNTATGSTVVCDSPFVVQFVDSSVSINGLSYEWIFGDGDSSTEKNPIHIYDSTGSYTVQLQVTDTVCNTFDSIINTGYITAHQLVSNFSISHNEICEGSDVFFTDQSMGGATTWSWSFGDAGISSAQNPTHTYALPGVYNVSLTVSDGRGCNDDTVFNNLITVHPKPLMVDFTSTDPISCQAPFDVTFFENISPDVVAISWNFGDGLNSIADTSNPTYTYSNQGSYTVNLTGENAFGCSRTRSYPSLVQIEPTVARFVVDTFEGCTPLKVDFIDQSLSNPNDPIVSWEWDFGDPGSPGNILTGTNTTPSHTYSNFGTYSPSLTITTGTGCIATITYTDLIQVGDSLFANFTFTPTTPCVNSDVQFTNLSPDSSSVASIWTFGDGVTSSDISPIHAYEDPGAFDVTLTVNDRGCRDDTTLHISVMVPKADFSFTQDCNIPNQVAFTDESEGADTWLWEFGDTPPGTSAQQNPTYTYLQSGNYTITLTVTNDSTGCMDEHMESVKVSIISSNFTASSTSVCKGEVISFNNLSTGTQLSYQWDFGDNSGTSSVLNPTYSYANAGSYVVTLTVTDVNGCVRTSTKNITVSGVTANFTSDIPGGCLPPTGNSNTVNFTDASVPSAGATITNWSWTFGDSNTSTVRNPTHTYNSAGAFTVSLTVTTDNQCQDTETKPAFISIVRPRAKFHVDHTLYCIDQQIPIINESSGGSLSYAWDLGSNAVPQFSNAQNPTPSYPVADTPTISLVVTNTRFGCIDSITKSNIFRTEYPYVGFLASDTFSYCPPHYTCFTNLSRLDTSQIVSVIWDFGDGNFSIDVDTPCHIYNRAGRFEVSITVQFSNLCIDNATVTNYITVGGATGNITMIGDSGCAPLNVLLDANSQGAVSHFWIFGDGEFELRGGNDSISHTYQEPSIYVPSVILTDTQNPPCSWELVSDYPVLADTVYADFTSDADTICKLEPIQFTDESGALLDSNFVSWLWEFGDGTTDSVQNPVHRYDSLGLMTVTLTATNGLGCGASVSKDIYVRDKPTAGFTITDTSGCDELTVTFTDTSSPGIGASITDWFWDFGITGRTDDTSDVQNPPAEYYPDTGSYQPTLFITDAEGCSDTASSLINIYKSPDGIYNASEVDICLGDSIQLFTDSIYASYTWTPDTALSDGTIPNPWAFPRDTAIYSVHIPEPHGCDTYDTITINVIPPPPLTITPYPDTAICLGDTAQLHAQGGWGYMWSPFSGLNNGTTANPLASPSQTTTYIVTNEGPGGCQNSDSVKVIVNVFTPNFLGERSCLGSVTDFADFSTYSDLPINSWTWDFGDSSALSMVRDPSHLYDSAGSYQVQLVVGDALGCTDSIIKTVIIDPPPNAFASRDTTICFGFCTSLFGGGGDTVYWTPMTAIDDPYSYNPTVCPETSTFYVLHATNGVCPWDTAGVRVEVIPTPVIETIGDSTILRGTNIQLRTYVDRYDSIKWTPADSLSCSDCESPVATPYIETRYVISVIDEYGCTNKDTVVVDVKVGCENDQVWVANAFTPNGDGINDLVRVHLKGVQGLNYFRIFDRWGKLVFETDHESEGWDGTDKNGKKLNSGVYVYVVEAVCFLDNTIVKTGNITLIK